ncbi:MAG: hypothetical protein RBR67_00995 [Desulfobacterium sp.]|nr:hypothetical protein [Desulfobacterium sp.]
MNLIEGYGQTEGTGVTTLSPECRVKFGRVGQAIKGADMKIADDGFSMITDRKKEIIVTAGGKNITPSILRTSSKPASISMMPW